MQFLEEEILEITETTWNALLGLEIQPSSATGLPSDVKDLFMGQVDISGAWEGAVILSSTGEMARSAAARIFSMECHAVEEHDQIDVIYELANIIAGNVKSLLPEPCQLSIPTVRKGSEGLADLPGAERVSKISFECHGQPLFVALWKRDESC